MTVCFFGNYIPDYPRIQVLKKGLRENGVKILECHTRKTGWRKFLELARQHKNLKQPYDILLVGMGGITLVWLAKLLSRRKIVFDAFVSHYLTNVEDRQKFSAQSLRAKYYACLEKNACKSADLVLLDTQVQIGYFVKKYNLPSKKFVRIFISTNDEIFHPISKNQNSNPGTFIIHWHGHIVPFHGLGVIIKAALELKPYQDIEFRLITRFNSKYEKIKSLVNSLGLTNIKFYPETSYQGLAQAISQADICLGVFGNNLKAQLVIPNKIYEAMACGKLVVTAKQPAIYEVFQDGIDIVTVKPEDPNDLAEKILWVKANPGLKDSLARSAHELFKLKLTPAVIARELKKHLDLLNDN